MKRFDVAAIGSGNIDVILGVPALPSRGGKIVGKRLAEMVGGTVANSACAMGRLGLRVASVSCVGNDYNGQAIYNDFQKFNVDCEFVCEIPGLMANLAVIFVDESGEKSLIYAPGGSREWDDLKAQHAIEQSQYLYTMPHDIEKFTKLAEYAHSVGTKVVVDIEPHIASTPERLNAILTLTDIAIFNYDGFVTGHGIEPDFSSLTQVQEHYQLEAVVVTLDEKGVIAVKGEERARRESYKISVIDTTGAGDVFNGAFVYSLIHNYSLADALEFSSATAAINITALGARGNLATAEEVAYFMRNN